MGEEKSTEVRTDVRVIVAEDGEEKGGEGGRDARIRKSTFGFILVYYVSV